MCVDPRARALPSLRCSDAPLLLCSSRGLVVQRFPLLLRYFRPPQEVSPHDGVKVSRDISQVLDSVLCCVCRCCAAPKPPSSVFRRCRGVACAVWGARVSGPEAYVIAWQQHRLCPPCHTTGGGIWGEHERGVPGPLPRIFSETGVVLLFCKFPQPPCNSCVLAFALHSSEQPSTALNNPPHTWRSWCGPAARALPHDRLAGGRCFAQGPTTLSHSILPQEMGAFCGPPSRASRRGVRSACAEPFPHAIASPTCSAEFSESAPRCFGE